MAATTNDRNTLSQGPIRQRRPYPLFPGAVIPRGVIVMILSTDGLARNGADLLNGIVVGVSAHAVDQTKGDTEIIVEQGIYLFANDGTITQANSAGRQVMVLDNQTVTIAATAANDIPAGVFEAIEGNGVWVNMLGPIVGAS